MIELRNNSFQFFKELMPIVVKIFTIVSPVTSLKIFAQLYALVL